MCLFGRIVHPVQDHRHCIQVSLSKACSGLQTQAQKRGKSIAFLEKHASKHRNANIVEDTAKPEDQVKDWMWIVGLIVTIVIAMIICQLQWVCSTTISTQIRH